MMSRILSIVAWSFIGNFVVGQFVRSWQPSWQVTPPPVDQPFFSLANTTIFDVLLYIILWMFLLSILIYIILYSSKSSYISKIKNTALFLFGLLVLAFWASMGFESDIKHQLSGTSPIGCNKWELYMNWECKKHLICPSNDTYTWKFSKDKFWIYTCQYSSRYYNQTQIVIENEWILKCEQSEDYKTLQATYGEKNTWIKWYRVQEEELYTRLEEVDTWFYEEPGCLIVMNGMWDGKILQLDLENLEPIYEMDLEEFITRWSLVDKDMLDIFLSKLETSEEIIQRVEEKKKELFR
jgi:hypothetical protein